MKKIIIAIIAVFSMTTLVAQTKIGHVNSQKLLDTMPSRKLAMKTLQELEQAGVNEIKETQADLEKKYNKYMAEREKLSPVLQQYEEEQIQKKQYALQQREQEIQQELQVKAQALNEPILKRLQKAVDIVAERKKINYVIDESVTLYFKTGIDLNAEVATELLRIDAEETKGK